MFFTFRIIVSGMCFSCNLCDVRRPSISTSPSPMACICYIVDWVVPCCIMCNACYVVTFIVCCAVVFHVVPWCPMLCRECTVDVA